MGKPSWDTFSEEFPNWQYTPQKYFFIAFWGSKKLPTTFYGVPRNNHVIFSEGKKILDQPTNQPPNQPTNTPNQPTNHRRFQWIWRIFLELIVLPWSSQGPREPRTTGAEGARASPVGFFFGEVGTTYPSPHPKKKLEKNGWKEFPKELEQFRPTVFFVLIVIFVPKFQLFFMFFLLVFVT